MIESKNIFFINILSKNFLILSQKKKILFCTFLLKRRRTKLKFKKKKKKKVVLITPSPIINNFFINYNKTTHFNSNVYYTLKKKFVYLLKLKIKWNFKKFKYHGKGFKVKKFKKLSKITFRFGKSHWTKLMYNKKIITIKRTKKNSYCCISIKNKTFTYFNDLIKKIKGINKYTKRGLRLTRQSLKKRFGKISQASSVYK